MTLRHPLLAVRVPLALTVVLIAAGLTKTNVWSASALFFVAALSALDTRARWNDFNTLYATMRGRRYTPLRFAPYFRSRCCRDVFVQASAAVGHGADARRVLHLLGYRWWHLLPDGTFSRNSVFLNPRRWRSALGL